MNGMFYVSGGLREETPPLSGFRPLESVECFDCANEEWRSAPPLCGPRVAAASATLNETLYICGGWLNERAQSSVERLKAGALAWEVVQPMSIHALVRQLQLLLVCYTCLVVTVEESG